MMELNKPLIQCTGAREHFAQPKDKVVLLLVTEFDIRLIYVVKTL
jgi:hypothetical protein